MIDRVVVRNFQSLRHVDVEMGKFTVLVGATSSGKSALMRAMQVLASNSHGSSFVSVGEKVAAISVVVGGQVVTFEKGDGVNRYKLGEVAFTKVANTVPEQITAALHIPVKSEINFAGQFDRPYLLDDSGSAVARELGELTHASRLMEAAREGNRRRLEASSAAKTRERDLADLTAQVGAYKGLLGRLAAMDEAETGLAVAEAVLSQSGALGEVLSTLGVAEAVVLRLQAGVLEVPDTSELNSALAALDELQYALLETQEASMAVSRTTAGMVSAVEEERIAHEELHRLLEEAGTCPVCGQNTKSLRWD